VEGKNKGGRPPIFNSVEEMQEKIEAYFKECEGKPITDDEGNVLTNKHGEPIIVGVKPLTITGLALALGFNTRQSLLNYEGKAEFLDTIKKAKSKVEQYAEERLFDKDGANGAKFSLSNNFKGWAEKQQIEADVKNDVNINIELVDDE
jgi:hypothetical protein